MSTPSSEQGAKAAQPTHGNEESRRPAPSAASVDEFVRAYDSLDHALDNLLDYLKLVRWSSPKDRNLKAALMWADRVSGYYGHCNTARSALGQEVEA